MEPTSKKSRSVALALAFILGVFGVHRMYVGKVAKGIVLLILTATFVGGIISLIVTWVDIIKIAAGVFEDSENRKISKW